MNITIHNVKYFKSQSRETHCFNATVKVDGKILCIVENSGHGGGDDVYPHKQSSSNWRNEFQAINVELGKENIDVEGYKIKNSLEIVVCDLMNTYLVEKKVKSLLKRRIVFVDGNKLYQMPAKLKPTKQTLIEIKKASWWTTNHKLLLDLPLSEAVRIYEGK